MTKAIHYVIAGGTFSHIRPHLALAAPAFGKVGMDLEPHLRNFLDATDPGGEDVPEPVVRLILTRMAHGGRTRGSGEEGLLKAAGLKDLITEEDMALFVSYLVAQPETRGIIMAAANVDFQATRVRQPHTPPGHDRDIGKQFPRLLSRMELKMEFAAAPKIVPNIRRYRKDIYTVGFKTTSGATRDEQFKAGLALLKNSSINLVLANDLITRLNMVITPEEASYHETTDRNEALQGLAEIYAHRSRGTFTRSTVVGGDLVAWNSPLIPDNLRRVVDHCIARGAYKPFQGKTVGHFATRLANDENDQGVQEILTTRRKSNYNDLHLPGEGLVRVVSTGKDTVIAMGAKPSVGGQSQRSIFNNNSAIDCIVHFHCPLKEGVPKDWPKVIPQWPNECGSMQCGEATGRGMSYFGDKIYGVMLDNHGPNIGFSKEAHPELVIKLIEHCFDLTKSTSHVGE